MEGVLHKWTNYLSGWQPRYFVLDGSVFSYYDSQEDVGKGSKGSIKMAVCEIKVHVTDNTRMDLIIPGEQYFYLKAVNAAERQKWLVALGSAKACLADSKTKKEREISENEDSLKFKMSELRLYCDLLMQQVHKIQESAQPVQTGSTPDLEVKRSVSHSGVVAPDRSAEMNSPAQPQKGSITVMRNLEEMAAYRASRWTRHPVEVKSPDNSYTAQPASKNSFALYVSSASKTLLAAKKTAMDCFIFGSVTEAGDGLQESFNKP
ncbi:pleckstrin homology domain-containing family A member 3-like isoform X3 [Pristis pectinata]|uniref:pleckstrin homology domain-containing family A member 3-like isoform X3 n=1 Tax=Pristis pectinata TaxID=685728 RepID=UPI00223E11FF|nr:pleckstrin homology domain-containing family A member 3-like isoform X3 [Pristis pectinata]